MKQEEIEEKNRQREQNQAMMEKLKRSKLRRRQAKELAKQQQQQQQEAEVPLDPEVEQKPEGGLRMPVLYKPGDKDHTVHKVSSSTNFYRTLKLKYRKKKLSNQTLQW